ncbi:uncharacterized protein LOC118348177 [Juglans regia]|uniref:Uncharacterized protein LOC118348177 n=1 Tax=Juglans regia TaxID=51240 RepID=A0A6P9ECE0_JUGRE|nr:uncharacterized protein LOC118348177 [Juglans regia]
MGKRKGETSRGNKAGNGWKIIWGLNVPNVVKHFLWRVALNLLPTNKICTKNRSTNLINVQYVRRNLNQQCMSCGAAQLPQMCGLKGLAEYKMAQDQLQTNQVRSNANKSVTKWEKPGGLVIKANWDAAVDAKNKCVRIGVVVRDSNGEILACLCSRFAHNSNSYVAEALGLRKAVTSCSEMGFSDVVLEGDSLIIVNATKSGEETGAEYGCIIDDVRRIMNGRLSWDVRFVYREANTLHTN